MFLKKKGLLTDCEQLLSPMNSDKEGRLRGGFAGIAPASAGFSPNDQCQNIKCANIDCNNKECGNGECGNKGCTNHACFNITLVPNTTTITATKEPNNGFIPCGFI